MGGFDPPIQHCEIGAGFLDRRVMPADGEVWVGGIVN